MDESETHNRPPLSGEAVLAIDLVVRRWSQFNARKHGDEFVVNLWGDVFDSLYQCPHALEIISEPEDLWKFVRNLGLTRLKDGHNARSLVTASVEDMGQIADPAGQNQLDQQVDQEGDRELEKVIDDVEKGLSPHERKVLNGFREGLRQAEIARKLGVSQPAVLKTRRKLQGMLSLRLRKQASHR